MTDADRHRILLKLGALWAARPDASLCEILTWDVYALLNELWVTDHELETMMDETIRRKGLSVSGGWKS